MLTPKLRSVITVSTLVAKGIFDSSFEHHMNTAKDNGVSREEMAEILTHAVFYAGWSNAWAAFRAALRVCQTQEGSSEAGEAGGDDADDADDAAADAHASSMSDSFAMMPMFGLGAPNDAYAAYFTGNSYLNLLTDSNVCGSCYCQRDVRTWVSQQLACPSRETRRRPDTGVSRRTRLVSRMELTIAMLGVCMHDGRSVQSQNL